MDPYAGSMSNWKISFNNELNARDMKKVRSYKQ